MLFFKFQIEEVRLKLKLTHFEIAKILFPNYRTPTQKYLKMVSAPENITLGNLSNFCTFLNVSFEDLISVGGVLASDDNFTTYEVDTDYKVVINHSARTFTVLSKLDDEVAYKGPFLMDSNLTVLDFIDRVKRILKNELWKLN